MWFQFKMSKSMWIISVLILIMMVSSFWFARDKERPWVKCKESLFAQVVFKQCTPSSFATSRGLEDDNQNKPIENELPYEPPQN